MLYMPYKICSLCKNEKELIKFNLKKAGKFGRDSRCKECISLLNKIRYKKDPELVKKRVKEWRDNLKLSNPELLKKKRRDRYLKRRIKELEKMKEWRIKTGYKTKTLKKKKRTKYVSKNNNCKKEWRLKNRKTFLEYKERLRLIKAKHPIKTDRCEYCGEISKDLCFEHKIPISRNGTDDPSNLAIVCRSCNSQKKDKTLDEYRIYAKEMGYKLILPP